MAEQRNTQARSGTSEVHLEPRKTSKMESFATVFNGFYTLNIFAKRSVSDVWLVPYTTLLNMGICRLNENLSVKSSHPHVSHEKAVLQNFVIFSWKHLRWSIFFNKIAAKQTPIQVFCCEFCEIFCFFKKTPVNGCVFCVLIKLFFIVIQWS